MHRRRDIRPKVNANANANANASRYYNAKVTRTHKRSNSFTKLVIVTSLLSVRHLLGYGHEWLAQYQDNVTGWCAMSWSLRNAILRRLNVVAESVEHNLSLWKVRSLIPSRVKAMTYKLDAYRYLTRRSALIG